MNRLKTILAAALVVGVSPAAFADNTNFDDKAEMFAVQERGAVRAGLIEGRNISPRVDRDYWFDRRSPYPAQERYREPVYVDPYGQPVRRGYGW